MPLPDGGDYINVEYDLGEEDPHAGNSKNPVVGLPFSLYSMHVNLYSYSLHSITLYYYYSPYHSCNTVPLMLHCATHVTPCHSCFTVPLMLHNATHVKTHVVLSNSYCATRHTMPFMLHPSLISHYSATPLIGDLAFFSTPLSSYSFYSFPLYFY